MNRRPHTADDHHAATEQLTLDVTTHHATPQPLHLSAWWSTTSLAETMTYCGEWLTTDQPYEAFTPRAGSNWNAPLCVLCATAVVMRKAERALREE